MPSRNKIVVPGRHQLMKDWQKLYTGQFAQRLKTLGEHAVIESAISSNRIEGVEVSNRQVGSIG